MKQLLRRTAFAKLDRYLCANHPVIWRTQIHWVLLLSLVLIPLCYVIGASGLLRIEMGHIPAHSNLRQLVNWLQIGVWLSLIYWLYTQYRVKLQEASVRSFGLTVALSAGIFVLIQMAPLALQIPIYEKLADSRSDALFERDWAIVESTGFLEYFESDRRPDEELLTEQIEQLALSYGFLDPEASLSIYPLKDRDARYLHSDFHFEIGVSLLGRTGQGEIYPYTIASIVANQVQAIYHGKAFQHGKGVYAQNQTFIWKEVFPFFLLTVLIITWLSLAPSARRPRTTWFKMGTWWTFVHRLNLKGFAHRDRAFAREAPERWRIPWHYVSRYVGLPVLLGWAVLALKIWSMDIQSLLSSNSSGESNELFLVIALCVSSLAGILGILFIWSRRPIGLHVRPRHIFWQMIGGSSALGLISCLLVLTIFWQVSHVGSLKAGSELNQAEEVLHRYSWVYFTSAHSSFPADLDLGYDYYRIDKLDIEECWGPRVFAYQKLTKEGDGLVLQGDQFIEEDWQTIARTLGYDHAEVNIVPVEGELAQAFINRASFGDSGWEKGMPWVKYVSLHQINDGHVYFDLGSYLENQIPGEVAEVRFWKDDQSYNVAALSHQLYLIDSAKEDATDFWNWHSAWQGLLICFWLLFGGSIMAHHIQFSFRMLGRLASIKALGIIVLGGILFILWGVMTSEKIAFELGLPLAYIVLLMTQIVIRADRKPLGPLSHLIIATSFMAIPIGCFILGGYLVDEFHFYKKANFYWAVMITGIAYSLFTTITLKNLHWAYVTPKRS